MTKQPKPEITREDVTPDTLLRLDVAARLAFPDGSIGLPALRREAKRERLVVWRIANKDMTTLAEVDRMTELCRVQRPPAPPLEPSTVIAPYDLDAAAAHARLKVAQLKEQAVIEGTPSLFDDPTVRRFTERLKRRKW